MQKVKKYEKHKNKRLRKGAIGKKPLSNSKSGHKAIMVRRQQSMRKLARRRGIKFVVGN